VMVSETTTLTMSEVLGCILGIKVGPSVGDSVDGLSVVPTLGLSDGCNTGGVDVGDAVVTTGDEEGSCTRSNEGVELGSEDGTGNGDMEGRNVGNPVGCCGQKIKGDC